jgi:hypothetical protein
MAGERPRQPSALDDVERGVTAPGMDNHGDEGIMRDAWEHGIRETRVVDVSYGYTRDIDVIEESHE